MTGRDIKNRDEQEKDSRGFVEQRGGRYVYTYEEPDTSAWKRKRVRLPSSHRGALATPPLGPSLGRAGVLNDDRR
ncbi:hypothetical protein ACFYRC_28030 [Streptomyces sp. NPDC005279]|uniref:hypothetical protein n=1 Tax=Streptomyces sp. NPDC005279 TaxID=3364712 RepID=UPI0036A2003C